MEPQWSARVRPLAPVLLCVFGLLYAATASAQSLSPEVSRGLAWLQSQVQANGSLANEASSVATALQDRSETAQALAALATLPSNLADAIASESDGNTEYLARQAIASIAAGRDASAQINLLLLRRNSDRGFGGGPGFESNPLDTAWAVLALARAGQGAGMPAQDARAYLMASLQSDGGVSAGDDVTRIEYSAAALYALQTTGDGSTATTIRALSAWLLQRQGADGSWRGDTYLTAFSVIAVVPTMSDQTVRAAASGFLVVRQSAGGSWLDDPFLTAVALRALSIGSASPAAAVLTGKVIDQSTNLALAGVGVSVSGTSSGNATTGSDGRFTVSNLTPGTYSAQVARAGYNTASLSYSVFAGQTLDAGTIPLSQIATTAIVRGRVTAATGGAALAGVLVSVTGSAALSAATDPSGNFEFSSVAPGGIVITASLAGFQSATGNATIAGGQTLVFSPALYKTTETTPTTGHFVGRTVAAGTNAPLPGVTIVLNGAVAGTSGSDGRFDLTLNPQSYIAAYNLAGYDSVRQSFVLSAGTIVDAGTVALPAQRTTTNLTGVVTASNGSPLGGATLQILGGASVTTGTDGAYAFSGLTGSSFDLRASATGYQSQLISLQVPRPSDVVQNFALFAGSGSFAIGDPSVSPASVAANADVTVSASITNTGSSSAAVVLRLQVIDLDGANGTLGSVVGTGAAFDAGGAPIGQIQLNASESRAVRFVWNSGRFAPGRYQLLMRLVAPGSITQATPQGSVLLERPAAASVVSQTHFAGSIIANPPVLRAGTNTPVKLSATLQNNGNTQLPPQGYTLSVIDTQTNAVAHAQTVAGRILVVSELDTLPFDDWAPAAGGNFRIELASPNPAEGKITASLYVGDAGSAQYTTNKLVVPAGTQTVRANITITGQDVTSGTISDPLVPLIKTAVQKAVTYNDAVAASETIESRCLRCHVQSQALVGGELTRKLTTYDANNRNTIFNALIEYQQSNGAIDGFGGYQMTQSMLGMWALNAWHKKNEIVSTLVKGAQFLESVQDGAGAWNADHVSGWWSTQVANTAFNVKNLIEIHDTLRQAPAGSAVNYVATPWVSGPFVNTYDMASDAAGNIYVSSYTDGKVYRVQPDGTRQLYLSGLTSPTAIAFAADGTPYVASIGGLYRREADGSKTLIAARSGSGLAFAPDGNLYMASYWDNKISKITPAGGVSDYIVGGGLINPWSIAATPTGDLVVGNYNGFNIVRYHADKSYEVVVGWTGGNPTRLQPNGTGWMLTTTMGLYAYNSEWQGERLTYTYLPGLAVTPDGSIVLGDGGGTLYRVSKTLVNSAAALAAMDASISKGVNWLLQDGNTDSNNNLSLAQRLIGLGAARGYYEGQPAADTLQAKMNTVATLLRSRVNADGGWGWFTGYGSDSLVTAQVGVALDYLNPSPSDPIVQNAVKLLLSRQQADGTWFSENNILTTHLAATTWVSIWLPIVLDRLGGIDTDVSATFASNVTMSSPDKAPATSTVNPDGTRTYIWKLTGVTSSGQEINYDLSLADMVVNEVRAVSTDAHLTFKNSFTGGNVDAPINVPRVTASAFLALGLATDRTTYGAGAPVNITGQVTNTDGGLLGGSVKFQIFAADNNLVATVGTLPFSTVAAGASANLTPVWNTGGTLAGAGYYVLATLYDSASAFVGTARSSFNIVSDAANLVSGHISADKLSYLPSETVLVTSRVSNLTQNQPLDNLTVVTTVTSPDGSVRFTRSEQIAQLPQATLKDYSYSLPLGFALAGSYAGALSVRDAGGAVLATSATSFTVLSSAATGSGLTGTLSATPKPVPFGDPIAFSAAVNNLGNADIPALQVKIMVVDPAAQRVLAEFPATLAIARAQTAPLSFGWPANAAVGGTYVAVLAATVGTATITLAQDSFVIAPPVTRVTGTLAAIPKQVPRGNPVTLNLAVTNAGFGAVAGLPLSVTIVNTATQQVAAQFADSASIALSGTYQKAFSWPATGAVGTGYTATLRATINGAAQTLAQDSFSIIAPPVQLDVTLASLKQARVLVLLSCQFADDDADGDHDAEQGDAAKQACVAQKSAFLASYLTALGVNYRITTTEDDFTRAFRSGQYNTYWITGGALKLDNDLTEEVREAVFRGDALILDAVHDERNHGLDAVAGTDVHGKLGVSSQAISVNGSIFAPGTLGSFGRPLQLDLTTGVAQAVFAAAPSRPAIVTNQYGLGRGILFAYNLVATLMTQPSGALNDLVSAAIGWVAPAPAAVSEARTYTVLRAKVTNVGIAADLKATFTPPAGATVLGTAPAATPDASGRPVWTFTLDSGATKNLDVGLRLPANTGSFTANISIDSARNDLVTPFSTFVTLSVESADTVAPRVADDLSALAVSSSDKSDRDHAVSSIRAAQASMTSGAYEQAIAQLIDAAEHLLKITSIDVSAQRVEVGRLLQEAAVRWFIAQP